MSLSPIGRSFSSTRQCGSPRFTRTSFRRPWSRSLVTTAFAAPPFSFSGRTARPSSRCEAEERMISCVSVSFMGPILSRSATASVPSPPRPRFWPHGLRGSDRLVVDAAGRLAGFGLRLPGVGPPHAVEERDLVQERARLVQHLVELKHDPDRLVFGAALGASDGGLGDRRRVGEPVPDLAEAPGDRDPGLLAYAHGVLRSPFHDRMHALSAAEVERNVRAPEIRVYERCPRLKGCP